MKRRVIVKTITSTYCYLYFFNVWMNFECTFIIAYVVNLRSGHEGLESLAGKLEATLEGILEVGRGGSSQ